MTGSGPSAHLDVELAVKFRSLFIDHVTAAVSSDFAAHGIECILLKGAAFARLFYEPDYQRAYTDTDLLVRGDSVPAAEQRLRALGFTRIDRDEHWLGPGPKYAHTWQRPDDRALVDLHWRLSGAAAASDDQWAVLSRHTTRLDVGARTITALNPSASAVLVGLHCAHHGTRRSVALSELDHVIARLEPSLWGQATRIAQWIGGADQFAAGLRLTAAGNELANRLDLGAPRSVDLWLKVNPSPYGAWALNALIEAASLRDRLRIVRQILIPSRAVMQAWFPLSRRGLLGLMLAYALRPLQLVFHGGPAVRAWLRGRRAVWTGGG